MDWTPDSFAPLRDLRDVDKPAANGMVGRGAIRFLDLTDDRCAFIADDPASVPIEDLLCCGDLVPADGALLGRRYCARHRRIVLVPRGAARAV